MQIFNNNNNNCGYPASDTPPPSSDAVSELSLAFISDTTRSRNKMILLALCFGWCGFHYFCVKSWLKGFFCLFLTLIGILGFFSLLSFLIWFPHVPDSWRTIALCLCGAFPLSVILGFICGLYWIFHTDRDFEKSYGEPKETISSENNTSNQ